MSAGRSKVDVITAIKLLPLGKNSNRENTSGQTCVSLAKQADERLKEELHLQYPLGRQVYKSPACINPTHNIIVIEGIITSEADGKNSAAAREQRCGVLKADI
eukprot:1160426-Pelagomonas_calceolata.AAC.7